jgi:hypothetical protein
VLSHRVRSVSVGVSRGAIGGLRDKYAQMLAMRLAHEAGDEDEAQVRTLMAAIASRFPGALREIDDLELAVIRDRIHQLDAVLGGGVPVEPWMEAVALFHELARGALCAKRWLAGRRRVDEDIEGSFAREVEGLAFPEDARAWIGQLARIAAPPRGRLTDLVYARMARVLGTSERQARRLVFGVRRRER